MRRGRAQRGRAGPYLRVTAASPGRAAGRSSPQRLQERNPFFSTAPTLQDFVGVLPPRQRPQPKSPPGFFQVWARNVRKPQGNKVRRAPGDGASAWLPSPRLGLFPNPPGHLAPKSDLPPAVTLYPSGRRRISPYPSWRGPAGAPRWRGDSRWAGCSGVPRRAPR